MAATSAADNDLFMIEWELTYAENPSLIEQLSRRDGVRAWARGFGGNTNSDTDGIVYNDFSVTAGGVVAGADVSLSDEFQLGAYVNYGNINLNHDGVTGGGGWNPDGYGGGITAKTGRQVYVQALSA